ncbi:MAG: hypothetical protein JOS17DRAFT_779858 [Linnemannia elongata]|nr:MAG: hypothetical protein JOS17DRAFT_779858 [Linnemannia elongata]
MKLTTTAILAALSIIVLTTVTITATPYRPLPYPGGLLEERATPTKPSTDNIPGDVRKRAAAVLTKPNTGHIPDDMKKRVERTRVMLAKRTTTPDPLEQIGKS